MLTKTDIQLINKTYGENVEYVDGVAHIVSFSISRVGDDFEVSHDFDETLTYGSLEEAISDHLL